MLVRVLFLILVGFTSYKSFQATSSISPQSHWTRLADREANLKKSLGTDRASQDVYLKKELSETFWQNKQYGEAEKLLLEVCSSTQTAKSSQSHSDFLQSSIELAGLYLDEGAFEKSIDIYQSALQYDKGHSGNASAAVARDLTNLGVTSYLAGTASEDGQRRQAYFGKAYNYYAQAGEIIKHLKKSPDNLWRLERILSNQELLVRDLNNKPQQPFDRQQSPNNRLL
jgi:tetratricopeptide (TPR) repeat protein